MLSREFEALLKNAMGLDAASIGSSCVERAVAHRMAATREREAASYLELLRRSPDELQELVEAVVVPETWFFRDREAFTTLGRLAVTEWWPANADGQLRVLSVPCSTGEEPYSMAMALQDSGMALERVKITAIDISSQALKHAEAGIYRKNSFRGDGLEFRDRYFSPGADGYRISKDIQRAVSFEQENLLAGMFQMGNEVFDFIFCRNLLIYFDNETQDRAIRVLSRLLKPKGVLFIGPSESGLLLRHEYTSAKIPLAFAFRKGVERRAAERNTAARPAPVIAATRSASAAPAKHSRPASPGKPAAPAAAASSAPVEDPLAKASRLADEGHLVEAAKICDEHLRKNGPAAQAYYLLGLVRDAAGEPDDADELYRKALYLDPNHYESLGQLALLAQKRGNASEAQTFQNRARRVRDRSSKLKTA